MNRRLLTGILLVGLCVPAFAQGNPPLNDAARNMLGTWEFSSADRERVCTATFKADAAGPKVEFDANCAALYPLVANIVGWRYPDNDLLYLLDDGGKALVEFSEVEDGIFEAPTPGVGVLFLQHPAAATGPEATPDQLAGDWIMRRGTATLCAVTLSTMPLRDALTLTVKPGCAASVAQLGFAQWRLDNGELLLVPARGQPWRFEAADDNRWSRVPETADGFTLARQ